jgi:hypothetical protein
MTLNYVNTLFPLVFPLGLLFLVIAARRFFRQRRLVKAAEPPVDHCKCGYLLKNLSVPRCPECGCVLGFNATPEQLGLTVEELERIHTVRERRNRDGVS